MGTLGDFYNYITFETRVTSDSDYGDNDLYTWTTFTNAWAQVLPESETESVINNQVENVNRLSWKIRYMTGITENMRIYFDGEYYDITGIREEGRRKFLILRTHKWSS